jgi:hypothetical protein
MKRISCVLSAALVLSSFSFAAEQTWTGQISDAMCGADHSMMKHGGKKVSARNCTLECAKGGSKYVFVSKGTVYEVKNQDLKVLQAHAGHTVKVTGEIEPDGKTIKVSKIVMPTSKKS